MASRALGLERYLAKIENLRGRNLVSIKDTERAYIGAFLEYYSHLENSIEKLFVGLLRGALRSSNKSVRARVSVKSSTVASHIVIGDRRYVDWLPYHRYTIPRARAFFSGGRPFTELDKYDIGALDAFMVIRNALVHHSAHASRRFIREFVDGRNLPPKQQTPAGYLRGAHTVGLTRMSHQFALTVGIVGKLAQ